VNAAKLRMGLAGCGGIARLVHLPLLAGRADVQLTAVAEPDEIARQRAVAQYAGGARAFRTLAEMLAETDLDAVVVALPTNLHADASRAVLGSRRHVFVEKPLAADLAGAAVVLESWQSSGLAGMVGFNCRANPLHLRLRDFVRSGRAGEIVYFRTTFATAPREGPAWKRTRATGGGVLLDLGSHHLDLIRFLFDREITGVRAAIDSRRSEDDTALLELELDGGIRGHAFFSLVAAETDRVEVFGERASLAVSRFTSLDVEVRDNPGSRGGAAGRALRRAAGLRRFPEFVAARRSPLRDRGYAALLDRFVHWARVGQAPADGPDLFDGFACSAAIDAAERSVTSRRMEAPRALEAPSARRTGVAT
jgi:predicted dehydrogenase